MRRNRWRVEFQLAANSRDQLCVGFEISPDWTYQAPG